MKFKKIAMVILQVITGFTVFSQAPREWWFGDAQRANDHYLNKFLQKNLSQ